MKATAKFIGLLGLLCFTSCSDPTGKRGPSLAAVENVVIVDTVFRNPDKTSTFNLTESVAAAFLNSAHIVSAREIHDHYSTGSDSYSGTATISGMDIKWTITNGGTGSITREFDGETYLIVDPAQREQHDPND